MIEIKRKEVIKCICQFYVKSGSLIAPSCEI